MGRRVLLVDYEWCTGCHTCEVACQMENGLPPDQFGIKVSQIGPWQYGEKDWEYTFIPTLTDQCNLCAMRLAEGKMPSCVQHCQAKCLTFVDADEASQVLSEKPKALLQVK